MEQREATRHSIIGHCNKYPRLTLQDLLKFIYQSSFGCEHAVSSPEAALARIREEYSLVCTKTEPPRSAKDCIEPLDGAYSRVDLGIISCGVSPEKLAELFCLSAKHEDGGEAALDEKLSVVDELIREELLPFSEIELVSAADFWKKSGYPPIRHSDAFREAYRPSYRVIANEYAEKLLEKE